MIYQTFYIDSLLPPSDCPDVTRVCSFGGLKLELRVINTPTVFGIVLGGVYLSLAAGNNHYLRGDYVLFKDENNRYLVGINENLY